MDSTPADLDPTQLPAPVGDDLSAIAWVHDELRRTLEAAHKSLRRYLKDLEAVTGSDIDAVDPGVLRAARSQIHQGVGALELVGLPAAAIVLRASETAVQRSVAKPQTLTPELVSDIEHASFGLLDYLARVLAGKNVSPLALFPQYRAVQEAVEAERLHPADLWTMDWRWREVASDDDVVPRQADAVVRTQVEGHLLSLMRGTQALTAAARMSELSAGLGAGSEHPHVRTFWNLAAAMFEAQHHGLLGFDVFTKRVTSRLLAQLRILSRGDSDVSERLARDLLFFCTQAAPAGKGTRVPRLAAVREAYGLVEQVPTDYSHSVLGRFDPALVSHAKKRLVAAKEAWSATAGGEMHRLAGLSEQFALVGDSLRKLFAFGESFAAELQAAVVQTQQSGTAPPAALAMEMATSLLYLEAALEDGDFDHPEHADRVRRLGERLGGVRAGRPPEPLEPWMEELYRRVSDRQTMGSVVQELRASLSEVEKAIDQFFRNPGDTGVLVDVPVQFSSMRGVLSVLGMDHAAQALLRMRSEVDGLVGGGSEAGRAVPAGVFERLAGNLSALGFLIDMLSVQPQMAKQLFRFDAENGVLEPVMGRSGSAAAGAAPVEPRLIEQAQMLAFSSVREDVPLQDVTRDLERLSHEAQAADQPALAAAVLKAQEAIGKAQDATGVASARGELSEALVDFVATATEPAGLAPVSEPMPLAPIKSISLTSDLEHDDEMRDIFLEEAREVVESAQEALADLRKNPADLGLLTTLRRAFHTLKGSSRMVGLKPFGEAAWIGEQVFNTQLADQQAAEAPLLDFTGWALGHLGTWVDDIAERRDGGRNDREMKLAAERLGGDAPVAGGTSEFPSPVQTAARPAIAAAPATAPPTGLPDDLPSRDDLELNFEATSAEPSLLASAAPVVTAEPVPENPAFELDLSAFDSPGTTPMPASPGTALPAGAASASPMFDRFDDAREEAMQTTLGNERFATPPAGPLDIDIDLGGAEASSMIESLAPSTPSGPPPDTQSGLLLDLSSFEAAQAVPPTLDIEIVEPAGAVEMPEAADAPAEGVDVELLAEPAGAADEHVKVVGPLRIGIPLFNIYLNEADELSRRLMTEVAEWAMELHRPVGEAAIALAHSLAGSSATVGFADLSHLARSLEHALARSQVIGRGTEEEAQLFVHAAEEVRRLLHQFAAGFLREPPAELIARLAEHELSSALRLEAVTAASELAEGEDTGSPMTPALSIEPLTIEAGESTELGEDLQPLAEGPGETGGELGGLSLPAVSLPAASAPAASPVGSVEAEADDEVDAGVAEAAPEPIEAAGEPVHATEPSDAAAEPIDVAKEPIHAAAEPSQVVDEPSHVVAESSHAAGEPSHAAAHADAPAADADEPAASTFGALAPYSPLGMAELKPLSAAPIEGARTAVARTSMFGDVDDDIDAVDAVDLELFPIFEEEAQDLLPRLDAQLRDWARAPETGAHAAACMRTLHTLKGGARLAGAMRLGEMAHRLETRIERLTGVDATATADDVATLQGRSDAMTQAFEALRSRDAQAYADAVAASVAPVAAAPAVLAAAPPNPSPVSLVPPAAPDAASATASRVAAEAANDPAPAAATKAPPRGRAAASPSSRKGKAEPPAAAPATAIDWSRFARQPGAAAPLKPAERAQAANQSAVRVRAPLLDRLVNQAGEVSITRSRIESGVGQIKSSLADLTDNLERLRGQLRDIELQGEVQMSSRLEAAKAAAQSFDPLEFDRFTRFQELTRMMAESVNDVATVQRTLQRSLEQAEDELVAQARLTRDLQDDLLRTRMVEFEGLSDRLYRVVRLAAKETGKQVRLDLVGGSLEVDRGVLDRMTGAFEHLLRNCVSHGIEPPEVRKAAGKDATGTIVVALSHEGNEVGVEFRDDGAGLDLQKIRAKGERTGLLPAGEHTDAELANLIFTAGFTTADTVTELAGRGVGMDVVRSEVIAMGGRIETATAAGQGTSFKLILPLTTAVTQVVMLRCGESTVAVPSTLVEIVRRATPAEIEAAYSSGAYAYADQAVPFFWLGSLLQLGARSSDSTARTRTVVIVRSAQQRIAVHVDEVLGNQEVVVKNLGPQLSRLPGLAGMTLLASGAVALIYNPVALATLYGDSARRASDALAAGGAAGLAAAAEPEVQAAPLILVVDDSLTVRRVTQRMLVREGYRVTLAKDGLDALERLAEEVPQIVLSDIEMPRMDGFDLVRNIRADARWRDLPVIMITSRIAQKHRDHATELGVDHYLGKPYSEEDLLALVGRYTSLAPAAA